MNLHMIHTIQISFCKYIFSMIYEANKFINMTKSNVVLFPVNSFYSAKINTVTITINDSGV